MHNFREMKTSLAVGVAALTAMGFAACSGEGVTEPDEMNAPASALAVHSYDVRVATQRSGSGALMFDVVGAVLDSVTSNVGTVFSIDAGTETGQAAVARVVYTGELQEGVVATLWVRGDGAPHVLLQQVAARQSLERQALDDFRITTSLR